MRSSVFIAVILIASLPFQAQEISLVSRTDPGRTKALRMDREITVITFERDRINGTATVDSEGNMYIDGRKIGLDDIMILAGVVRRNPREKIYGLGMTTASVMVLPFAAYYLLGGIAWGVGHWIFVGSAVLAFDLVLAYAGTTLMGIFPRRFSTMNWQVVPRDSNSGPPLSLPLPGG